MVQTLLGVKILPFGGLFAVVDRISWQLALPLFLATFFSSHTFAGYETTLYCHMTVAGGLRTGTKIFQGTLFQRTSFLRNNLPCRLRLFSVCRPQSCAERGDKVCGLHFFPMVNIFFSLFEYFGVTLVTVTAGEGIGIFLKKLFPRLLALLVGRRQKRAKLSCSPPVLLVEVTLFLLPTEVAVCSAGTFRW